MVNRRLPSIADQLERESDNLDRLIRDTRRLDRRDHGAHFADLEERAQAIVNNIRSAFRGYHPVPPRPLSVEVEENGRSRAWF